MAKGLARPSNVMVLDEPTNDLDLETLDLMQELLDDYAGTVLLVSHDRDFIDRVATSVLAFEGNGRWTEYAGGYSDMTAQRGYGVPPLERDGQAQPRPARPARITKSVPPPVRKRLGFKEKHALEILPERIETLQRKIESLDSKLSDPEFYGRAPEAFNTSVELRDAAQQELNAAEEEWLALEILREETER